MAAVSEEEAAAVCSCVPLEASTSLVVAQSQICMNCGPIAAQPLQQVPAAAMDSGVKPLEAATSVAQAQSESNNPVAAEPLQQVPTAAMDSEGVKPVEAATSVVLAASESNNNPNEQVSANEERVWFSSKRKRSPPGKSGSGRGPDSGIPPKRARGRPPGSTNKKKETHEALGSDIIPYVINVEAGQDVFLAVREFAENVPRGICILCAHGGISDVTLRETPNRARTLPGPYDIVSMSGSFMPPGGRNREMCILVAQSDGGIFGGRVAGPLIAVSPVEVILAGFVAAARKKQTSSSAKSPSPSQGTL